MHKTFWNFSSVNHEKKSWKYHWWPEVTSREGHRFTPCRELVLVGHLNVFKRYSPKQFSCFWSQRISENDCSWRWVSLHSNRMTMQHVPTMAPVLFLSLTDAHSFKSQTHIRSHTALKHIFHTQEASVLNYWLITLSIYKLLYFIFFKETVTSNTDCYL